MERIEIIKNDIFSKVIAYYIYDTLEYTKTYIKNSKGKTVKEITVNALTGNIEINEIYRR